MKEKIAFTVTRYGENINGGAELHCRMLAERLADRYDVEVLTTCVTDYVTGKCGFEEGTSTLNGVTVRRFPVRAYDKSAEKKWQSGTRSVRRVRRMLYRLGWLKYLAAKHPVCEWGLDADVNALKCSVFYSPEMISYIETHKSGYKAVISITATYAPFYFTAMAAGEKMIGIPTLHPERAAFRPYLTQSFTRIACLGFNTRAEMTLAENIFGRKNISGKIISTGIEDTAPADWNEVKRKYALPDKYAVFIGRIEKGKAGKLIGYYKKYVSGHPDAPKLVMVGGIVREVGRHKDIIYTGFVSDSEKRSILQHALLLINPSKYESLSLVLLEALRDNIPVLVNGRCNVLKEHCILSGGAVRYYTGYRDFRREFGTVTADCNVRENMIAAGKKYYEENYSWNVILPRLYGAIDDI